MSETDSTIAEESEQIEIQLEWPVMAPSELPLVFCNIAMVQHDADMFYVSFGQISPPVIPGETLEERRSYAQLMDPVQVRTVAKVAVTPKKLKEIIQAMQTNLERFGKR